MGSAIDESAFRDVASSITPSSIASCYGLSYTDSSTEASAVFDPESRHTIFTFKGVKTQIPARKPDPIHFIIASNRNRLRLEFSGESSQVFRCIASIPNSKTQAQFTRALSGRRVFLLTGAIGRFRVESLSTLQLNLNARVQLSKLTLHSSYFPIRKTLSLAAFCDVGSLRKVTQIVFGAGSVFNDLSPPDHIKFFAKATCGSVTGSLVQLLRPGGRSSCEFRFEHAGFLGRSPFRFQCVHKIAKWKLECESVGARCETPFGPELTGFWDGSGRAGIGVEFAVMKFASMKIGFAPEIGAVPFNGRLGVELNLAQK
jgi:hypothetical protein